MQLTIGSWLLALSPVVVILLLMLLVKWGGSKAGGAAFLFSIVIAIFFFGLNWPTFLYSQVRGLFLSLDVLLIIWSALLIYNVAEEAGAVRVIGITLPRLTPDRLMQGLLLGWLFASFLQGMGGFGVPVAVAAPLLVGLGFDPVNAVIMACLGHGWAVNFGSMATSFETLIKVTGLPGEQLAPLSALLLGLSAFACGALVALVASGWKGLLRSLPAVAILTGVMGGVQYVLATNHLWTLGATGGAMAGLLVGFLLTRWPLYRRNDAKTGEVKAQTKTAERPRPLLLSLSAYIVLVILVVGVKSIPIPIPEVSTNLGFVTAAKATQAIKILSHPGTLLILASLIAYLIYSLAGFYKPGSVGRIARKVAKSAVNSSLGILAMVGMAMIMTHTGMTDILAQGLSRVFSGKVYPVIAPFIGALGAFITGSNNSSNVLFAGLQMRTAELLNLPVLLVLAAQTAGGSLGSVMAPAKVIVGCSTVGLGNNESKVMGRILLYGIIPVAFVAFLALILVI
jgi:lactate permease